MLIGIIPYLDERPDLPDAAACTTYLADYLRGQGRLQALAGAAADGTLLYDGARAAACLDEYAAMSCDLFGHSFDDVRDMRSCTPFVANRATGDACEHDDQCPTRYCTQATDGADPTCLAKPAEGEPCPVAVCGDGLYCDAFGDGTCKPLLADGADCIFHEDCGSGYCSYETSTGDTGSCDVATEWVCDGP